jgi:vacuolar-type H+-ATPase subunit I/STV1
MTAEHDNARELKRILLPRGEVMGIGKFKVKKTMLKLEIPRLSFVLIRESDTSFISTCINLRTDGYGNTKEYAIVDMIDEASYLLKENFSNPDKEKAWESLEDWFLSDKWSSELWDAYRRVQIEIAKQGRSLDDGFERLRQRIEELERRVDELESDEAEWLKINIVKYKKIVSMQYGSVGEEAA